jgi:hypothetical protein
MTKEKFDFTGLLWQAGLRPLVDGELKSDVAGCDGSTKARIFCRYVAGLWLACGGLFTRAVAVRWMRAV